MQSIDNIWRVKMLEWTIESIALYWENYEIIKVGTNQEIIQET